MTSSRDHARPLVPFLVRRSEPIRPSLAQRLRYDASRQVAQVDVAGQWIDAPDAPNVAEGGTLITRVRAETTDDQ